MTITEILPPSSVWMQLSSMFFLGSGLFNDLLVIRCSLTLANFFLLLAATMGLPSFLQSFIPQQRLAVDTMVWSSLNLLMHGLSVIRIFYDERHVELTTDQEGAPLWRYIYRQSGLSKEKFKKFILPTLELVEYEPGQEIPLEGRFFIVLEGVCHAEAEHLSMSTTSVSVPEQQHLQNQEQEQNQRSQSIRISIVSGQMFPLQHMCLEYMPTDNVFTRTWMSPVVAATHCKLYSFPSQRMKDMSKHSATRDAWMALLVSTLAMIAERPYFQQQQQQQQDQHQNSMNSDPYCYDRSLHFETRNRLFDPLEPSEEPDHLSAGSSFVLENPFGHLWHSMKQSFYFPWPIGQWPIGLRHNMSPPTDPKTDEIRTRLSTYKNKGGHVGMSVPSSGSMSSQSEELQPALEERESRAEIEKESDLASTPRRKEQQNRYGAYNISEDHDMKRDDDSDDDIELAPRSEK